MNIPSSADNKMKEIILIGGGGHCKSVIDVIEQEAQFLITGIVDNSELIGTDILGYPVIGSDLDLRNFSSNLYLCVGHSGSN